MSRRHALLIAFVLTIAVVVYVAVGVSWLAGMAVIGVSYVVLVASP